MFLNNTYIYIAELSLVGVLGAPPDFGSSINPFLARGGVADYAQHITVSTPGFGNLTTSLYITHAN